MAKAIKNNQGKLVIRKNLDLTPACVDTLTKAAVDHKTVFKLLAENILEAAAAKRARKN